MAMMQTLIGSYSAVATVNGFDISTLTEQSVTTLTEDNGSGRGIYISPDGYHLYLFTRQGTDTIRQYYLSTPFYPGTSISHVRSKDIGVTLNATGITFSNDGTKVAVCGSGADQVRYATLSTAWNVSTVSSFTVAHSNFNISNLGNIQFINDGEYFFRGSTGGSSYRIFKLASDYNLASAPTATYGTNDSGVWMCVKKDGTMGIGRHPDRDASNFETAGVVEHTYSTAYDPSTYTETDYITMSNFFSNISFLNAVCSSTEASGADADKHVYFYDRTTERLVHFVAS